MLDPATRVPDVVRQVVDRPRAVPVDPEPRHPRVGVRSERPLDPLDRHGEVRVRVLERQSRLFKRAADREHLAVDLAGELVALGGDLRVALAPDDGEVLGALEGLDLAPDGRGVARDLRLADLPPPVLGVDLVPGARGRPRLVRVHVEHDGPVRGTGPGEVLVVPDVPVAHEVAPAAGPAGAADGERGGEAPKAPRLPLRREPLDDEPREVDRLAVQSRPALLLAEPGRDRRDVLGGKRPVVLGPEHDRLHRRGVGGLEPRRDDLVEEPRRSHGG